jgi:hypothetical protein
VSGLDVSPSVGPQGSRLGIAGVRLHINARDLERIETMFAVAPTITAKHMRDVFGQFAGSHRKAVVAGATPNYQRLLRKSLFYRVRPRQVSKSSAKGVGALVRGAVRIEDIRMRIWATSQVTLLHETGGTVTAKGGAMAIPVAGSDGNLRVRRTRKPGEKNPDRAPVSPSQMKAAGITLVRKGNLLFRVDKTAKGNDRLKLTHLLTGAVRIKPALGILRHWNALSLDRQRRLSLAINAVAAEMARVVGRRGTALLTGALRGIA